MKHKEIIGARVEKVTASGTTLDGQPMYLSIQITKPTGETYLVKAARLSRTNIYATRIAAR